MNMNDYRNVTDRIRPDDRCREELLTEYKKERSYAMSKRKNDIEEMPGLDHIEVSGVERYRRPAWYKSLSIAAAAVLCIAGIGGSMAVISRSGHSPGTDAGAEDTIAATMAEAAESVTEEITEAPAAAEDIDADAVAQEMVKAYDECLYDIWGRSLQVDTSDIVEKEFNDEGITKHYYRVDDPRYPTWEDLERHCYDVFDTELAEVVLFNRDLFYAPEEEMDYQTMFFTRGNSYYRLADLDGDPASTVWDQEKANGELTPEGDVVATMTRTIRDCYPNYKYITEFRFVKTENGWRIKEANESSVPIDENGQPTTDGYADPS